MLQHHLSIFIFWLVHASVILAFLVPFQWSLVALAVASHCVRMLGITLGYHRNLSHRAFRLNRVARFLWAVVGASAMQKGPIWWAGNHFVHHRHADREGDPHSPTRRGFYAAHVGWFLNDFRYSTVDPDNPVVRHLSASSELVWLERLYVLPPALLALGLFLWGGLPWLLWGFCIPTVTVAHSTYAINSICHLYGSRRFATPDTSRNNPLLALLTLGEGWHNNHHRFQSAARNGFYWWELDPTYWLIRLQGLLGLARDIRPVPIRLYAEASARQAASAALS